MMQIDTFRTRLEDFDITISKEKNSVFLELLYSENEKNISEDTFEIINNEPEILRQFLVEKLSIAIDNNQEIIIETRDNYLSLGNLNMTHSFEIRR